VRRVEFQVTDICAVNAGHPEMDVRDVEVFYNQNNAPIA
jgi:hypothetical protein